MDINRARAPFIDVLSSRGLAIAASAARSARRSPVASPVPIIAVHIWLMTEQTSAKSRLTSPSLTIRSVVRRCPSNAPIGHRESVDEGRLLTGDAEQVLIRDDSR